MRLGDLDALKKALEVTQYNDIDDLMRTERLIDNAETVEAYTEEQVKELVELNKKLSEERPQGEWRVRTDTEWHFECNQCKGLSPWESPFCPNCGADMGG